MDKLDQLRQQIPTFKCKEGCADCCSYHCTMSESEMKRICERYPNVDILPPDYVCGNVQFWEFCMFLAGGKCAVYEERPIRCRLYGVTDNDSIRKCPHGCAPEQPWTDKQVNEVLQEYEALTKGEPEYITFGLIDGQIKPIRRGENG